MERHRRKFIALLLGLPGLTAFLHACGGGDSGGGGGGGSENGGNGGGNGGNGGGNGGNGGGNGGNGGNGAYGAGLTDPKPMFGSPKSERLFVSNSTGEYGSYAKSTKTGKAGPRMTLKDFERLT